MKCIHNASVLQPLFANWALNQIEVGVRNLDEI